MVRGKRAGSGRVIGVRAGIDALPIWKVSIRRRPQAG